MASGACSAAASAISDQLFQDIAEWNEQQKRENTSQLISDSQRRDNVGAGVSQAQTIQAQRVTLTEEHLSALYFLFQKNLDKALQILDAGGVQKVTANPSQRSFFYVQGHKKESNKYVCFPTHFCQCPSFFYEVVSRSESICCKHQIATRLGEALGLFEEVFVSDVAVAETLMSL